MDHTLPVLDLACGTGRNGLLLAHHGIPVVFADVSAIALDAVRHCLEEADLPGQVWQVDLEQVDTDPLSGRSFSAVLGFRYLHRPLFPALRNAVRPGGYVIYETFTVDNRRFGRPGNPDFLLRNGELESLFSDWQTIHTFEGFRQSPDRMVAQLVTRKLTHHKQDGPVRV
jgi:SAM-dependent methyltransferase